MSSVVFSCANNPSAGEEIIFLQNGRSDALNSILSHNVVYVVRCYECIGSSVRLLPLARCSITWPSLISSLFLVSEVGWPAGWFGVLLFLP